MFKSVFRVLAGPIFRPLLVKYKMFMFREVYARLKEIEININEIQKAQLENDALYFSLIGSLRNPLSEVEKSFERVVARTNAALLELEGRMASHSLPPSDKDLTGE